MKARRLSAFGLLSLKRGSVLEHEKGQDLVPFVEPHGIAARAALKDQVAVDRGLQALDVGLEALDGLVVGAAELVGVALDWPAMSMAGAFMPRPWTSSAS